MPSKCQETIKPWSFYWNSSLDLRLPIQVIHIKPSFQSNLFKPEQKFETLSNGWWMAMVSEHLHSYSYSNSQFTIPWKMDWTPPQLLDSILNLHQKRQSLNVNFNIQYYNNHSVKFMLTTSRSPILKQQETMKMETMNIPSPMNQGVGLQVKTSEQGFAPS